jgi:hypothetical protein
MEAAFLCSTRYRAVDSWLASGLWRRVSVIRGEIQKTNSYHFAVAAQQFTLRKSSGDMDRDRHHLSRPINLIKRRLKDAFGERSSSKRKVSRRISRARSR